MTGTNSINFSDANTGVGGIGAGDNTLTAQEVFNYLQAQNTGRSASEIKVMMQDLNINVDATASVTLDFNDAVNDGTDSSLIDFDILSINDTNSQSSDFQIYIADSDGLIVDANTVGSLGDEAPSVIVDYTNISGTNTVSQNVTVGSITVSKAQFDIIKANGFSDADIA